MSWNVPADRTTGDLVLASEWNELLGTTGSLAHLATHNHDGVVGGGASAIGPLSTLDLADGAVPSAPGAGKTRIYAVTGRPRFRDGALGVDSQLVTNRDYTTQGDIPMFDGVNLARLAPGVDGQFLKTKGAGVNPEWSNIQAMNVLQESDLAGLSTLSFASISQAYRTLLLTVSGITDSTAITLRNNGITSASYDWEYGEMSPVYDHDDDTAQTALRVGMTAGANERIDIEIWIMSYSIATAHFAIVRAVQHTPSTPRLTHFVGDFSGSDAITSLTLLGTWDAGRATLYGIPTI